MCISAVLWSGHGEKNSGKKSGRGLHEKIKEVIFSLANMNVIIIKCNHAE